ncbi:RNA polymerase sigma factor [Bacteroides timonensis]|jgi:RNA polymerase sigma factor, sigma-70 family|uniref:RNA polymerase sigma factor n=1 Tax=Bacteroides timonensis TaxID=1470345 RepID=UPI0005C73BF6|nr:sigma-70 family RNA polymerase sigma factor [Bacteroides timonensis]
MPVTDLLLWKRFIGGDEEAYACIYKQHVDSLYSYASCFINDKCLVEDCIQDLFIKIYQNRKNLGETNNIKLYLFVALKRQLFNSIRNEVESVSIEDAGPVFSIEYTVEDRMIEREHDASKNERILEMLKTLTPHQKEIIYYRFEEGLSYEEIGVLMDMKAQSAQNIIQRALKKLRETFSAEDFFLFLLFFTKL